jgi:hypothetical protein
MEGCRSKMRWNEISLTSAIGEPGVTNERPLNSKRFPESTDAPDEHLDCGDGVLSRNRYFSKRNKWFPLDYFILYFNLSL